MRASDIIERNTNLKNNVPLKKTDASMFNKIKTAILNFLHGLIK